MSHLGGSGKQTHIDLGLLSFLKNNVAEESFLDIGCGPGGMVLEAKKTGI